MSNFQNLDNEEIEQDALKEKLDLITVTSAKNLDDMRIAIVNNSTVTTTHSGNFNMTNVSTLRTYAETTRASADSLTSTVNTHETEINTLQGYNGLVSVIKLNINGAYAIAGDGSLSGLELSTTNPLTTTLRRYILTRSDTYSSNITLSDSDTKFSPSETGWYLSILSYEIYDNSTTTKTVELELYGDTEAILQNARNTVTGTSTNYEYQRVNNTQLVYLTAGRTYYFRAKSSSGGVINSFNTVTNFTLMRMSKTLT